MTSLYFNPLHHEGGDFLVRLISSGLTDFNPLHHEGGDLSKIDYHNQETISIHSTTRVETVNYGHRTVDDDDFNPLHHEGGDATQSVKSKTGEMISIHSTTRVETLISSVMTGSRIFQSTPPRGWRQRWSESLLPVQYFNPLHHEGGDLTIAHQEIGYLEFQSTPPRGWRQQYYTITTTILQHISTNKSYPTPSNHGQPSLYTRKSVLIVQIFRCESPRKSMFASGSHQNTLYRFTARGQVRISAVLPH